MAEARIREIGSDTKPTRLVSTFALALIIAFAAAGQAVAQDIRIIDRFAGGSNGDGGPATGATLNPTDMVADALGNLFIADTENHLVRRVDAVTGFISTVAGTGVLGYSGDGGPAVEANLNNPIDVDVDALGNLYISDRGNHRVRKVHAVTGVITTVAGTGSSGFSGDNGPATSAQLYNPAGVAVDIDGSIYISDMSNNRIRKVLPGGGIRTYAGNGTFGFAGDDGPASNARLALPADVTIGPGGDLYIADFANQRVRVVRKSTERIFTAAGSGQFAMCDNVAPQEACFRNPISVVYDPTENALFLADAANHRVRRIPLGSGVVTTMAGTGADGYNGDGFPAQQAWLDGPSGVAVHPTLGIFVGDLFNARVRRITRAGTPIIHTWAGNGNLPYAGDGGPALSAKFSNPAGIAHDTLDQLYIADSENHRIRRIDVNGNVSTVAGTGTTGFSGDNGSALDARLASPSDVAIDRTGNIYIADKSNHRIRRVTPTGVITTIMGTGQTTSSGDGGQASSASTVQPSALALYENASGTQRFLYVLEPAQHKVRAINLNTNIVNRFAGNGTFGFAGDGGQAAAARLAVPLDIAADNNGNVYIADTANHRIRKVSANGVISTIAGTGTFGFDGDGGLAISAKLAAPDGVAPDPFGNVLLLDTSNRRVRMISTDGTIQTIAGTGHQTGRIDGEGGNPLDDLGDGGPSTGASFSTLKSLSFDGEGNGYICDSQEATIRWIEDLSGLFSPNAPQGGLSGTVRYATSLASVPAVTVRAFGQGTESASTTSSGAYDFDGLESAPWLVEPIKNGGFTSSAVITPLDAAFVLQELVGLRNLTTAQRLACDVTGDGDLSALDATRILQRALGSATPFTAAVTCGSDWLFEPDAAGAPNQTEIVPLLDGGTTCRRGGIQFNPLSGQPDRQDFIAVIIGDCTTNFSSSGAATSSAMTAAMASTSAAAGPVVVLGPERRTRHTVRIPVSIDGGGSVNALQLELAYDSSLRPKRIVRRGSARNAVVGWRETAPGELTLVLASSGAIAAPAHTALILDFEVGGTAPSAAAAVRSASARIDEREAGVRVKRRGQRR